jgi:hypothetical protein
MSLRMLKLVKNWQISVNIFTFYHFYIYVIVVIITFFNFYLFDMFLILF